MFQEFPEEADGYGDLFAFSPSTSAHLRATILERLTGKKLTVRPLLLGAAESRQGRVNWMELVILNKSKVVKPEVTPEATLEAKPEAKPDATPNANSSAKVRLFSQFLSFPILPLYFSKMFKIARGVSAGV